jgi:hypothetical protein
MHGESVSGGSGGTGGAGGPSGAATVTLVSVHVVVFLFTEVRVVHFMLVVPRLTVHVVSLVALALVTVVEIDDVSGVVIVVGFAHTTKQ